MQININKNWHILYTWFRNMQYALADTDWILLINITWNAAVTIGIKSLINNAMNISKTIIITKRQNNYYFIENELLGW